MVTPLLNPLTDLLNRSLQASTPGREQLKALVGHSFAVHAGPADSAPLFTLRFDALETGLQLSTSDAAADATLTGTPLGLMAMLAGRKTGRLMASGVHISGHAEVATAFEALLRHASPDAEAELARVIGDHAAHATATAARQALTWGRQTFLSLARQTKEYLTEESRDLVPSAELDQFLTDVDRLREDVDRLAARVALAATRVTRTTPVSS